MSFILVIVLEVADMNVRDKKDYSIDIMKNMKDLEL